MTVTEIVKKYLEKNGYSGLVNIDEECGCENKDLFPCCGDSDFSDCEAGYKRYCKDCPEKNRKKEEGESCPHDEDKDTEWCINLRRLR